MAAGPHLAKLFSSMGAMDPEPVPAARWNCAGCGDVIGVYEPLVHVIGAMAHRTSRAADPELGHRSGLLYHAACAPLGGADCGSDD
jgi:hypothetical protein